MEREGNILARRAQESTAGPESDYAPRYFTEPNPEYILPRDREADLESSPAQANHLPALVPREQESHYRFQPQLILCRVAVMSLKQADLSKVTELMQFCAPQLRLEVAEIPLLKSQLRGFEFKGSADLAVLHHKAEGRLLLTDRNGFYHDLLGSAYRACGGRVLVLVTNTQKDPPPDELITEEIRTVAVHGDQPTVGKLAGMGKVLSWRGHPNGLQQQHICNSIMRALSHPLPDYGDLPDNFKPNTNKLRCPLL